MASDDGTTLTSAGATRSNLYLKAVNNTYYGQLAFTNGTNASSGGISYNNSGQYMQFETSTSEWMRLTSGGNLLIGTTTDSGLGKLQVTGAATFSSSVTVTAPSGSSEGLKLICADTIGDGYISYFRSSAVRKAYFGYGGSNDDNFTLMQEENASLIFGTNSAERMRITSGGNVGIGTSSPANILHTYADLPRVISDTSTRFAVFNLYYQGAEKGAFYLDNQNKDIILEANGDNTYGLRFSTAGTERMRITSAGLVAIGTTSALINESSLAVTSSGNTACFKTTTASGNSTILSWNNVNSGDNYFIEFGTETTYTVRGSITYNRGSAVTAYNTTSDYRLKTEISDFNALEIITNLKPKKFKIGDAINKSFGFIAHELQEYLPQAVTGEKDEIKEDGTPKYQQVDYSQLTGLLVKAIQEQQAQIEELKNKLNKNGNSL